MPSGGKTLQPVSLGEALFSGTRQKVLGLLFGQPERWFTLSELIQLARAGSGAVQREVERLTTSGLLEVSSIGRQKFYRANSASPIHAELCGLIRKTLGPAEQLRITLEAVGDDILLAVLYGSVAKQSDRADSDIDVLLVSNSLTLEAVFRMLGPVETELGRHINPTLYTQREFMERRANNHPFLRKVLTGSHIVLKGRSDEWKPPE